MHKSYIDDIYYKEVAHMITEAKGCQDLQSEGLTTRRANGVRSRQGLKAGEILRRE